MTRRRDGSGFKGARQWLADETPIKDRPVKPQTNAHHDRGAKFIRKLSVTKIVRTPNPANSSTVSSIKTETLTNLKGKRIGLVDPTNGRLYTLSGQRSQPVFGRFKNHAHEERRAAANRLQIARSASVEAFEDKQEEERQDLIKDLDAA